MSKLLSLNIYILSEKKYSKQYTIEMFSMFALKYSFIFLLNVYNEII